MISAAALLFAIDWMVGVLGGHVRVHTSEKPEDVTLSKVYFASAACAFANAACAIAAALDL